MSVSRASGVLAVMLTLLVTAGAAFVWVRAHQPPLPPGVHVIALVNGTPITRDDLDVRLEQMLPTASYHGAVAQDRLVALKRAALDDLVLDEVIYREAVAQGLRARAGDIDVELAAVKKRFDNAAQFEAALEQSGMTEGSFRERLARTVLVRDARAAHARQAITEADITAYFAASATKFRRPERVHLLEILIGVDPAQPSSAAAAEKKARETLWRLRRGAAFDALARAVSQDEYRVKDGDMGLVHRGRLDAEFESAVFAATPGRFEIARSLYGFEVFKVVERQAATQLSPDEARPIIAERLERVRREEALRAWHQRLLAGARVDIRDAVLRTTRAADLPAAAIVEGSRVRPGMSARSSQ